MHTTSVLFVLLAFSTRVVLCFFKGIKFSTPEQCGSFSINFSDPTSPPVLPLSLTIVPIFANPITIRLPDDSWDNSSNTGTAHVTFLPLTSGTQFVASLDDGTGASVGVVSDLLAVQPSNVTSCLAPKQGRGQRFYAIRGNLNQCSRFNVTFNPSTIKSPPSIRAFLPRSFSFPVNATDTPLSTRTLGRHSPFDDRDDGDDSDKDTNSDTNNNKGKDDGSKEGNRNDDKDDSNDGDSGFHPPHNISSKEYLLNVIHGFQAILTLDDGEGHRQSSRLFTAGGTSSSPSACFKESFNIPDGGSSLERGKSSGLSRTVKLVIAIIGASVLIALVAILFILFQRRRKARKDLEKTSFVFTEDVDMGSSFVSLATRIRTRISHLAYGKRSVRSYRSYRDEKDGASTWIPTSPIGSPAPVALWHASSPLAEKKLSWATFAAPTNTLHDVAESSSTRDSRIVRTINAQDLTIPSLGIDYPTYRSSESGQQLGPADPDPLVSRSSKSSRFILGSGYLSSRTSGAAPTVRTKESSRPPSLPPSSIKSSGKQDRGVAVLSSDLSSLGYSPSILSNGASEMTDNGIYVSSPIRPTLDVPEGVSDSGTIERPPDVLMRDTVQDSRNPSMKGNLRRERTARERGRIIPFPTVSLRISRQSSQQSG